MDSVPPAFRRTEQNVYNFNTNSVKQYENYQKYHVENNHSETQ